MRRSGIFLVLAAALSLLAACSHSTLHDENLPLDQRLAQLGYRQGEAVDSVPYWYLEGWQYIDKRHITFGQGPGPAYLVEFSTPCNNLDNGSRLSVSNTIGSVTRLDRIISTDFAGTPEPCLIGQLYKLEPVPKPVREAY